MTAPLRVYHFGRTARAALQRLIGADDVEHAASSN